MFDRDTRRSRGFGFVTYEDPGVCRKLLMMGNEGVDPSTPNLVGRVEMQGKVCEIKAATPKEGGNKARRESHPKAVTEQKANPAVGAMHNVPQNNPGVYSPVPVHPVHPVPFPENHHMPPVPYPQQFPPQMMPGYYAHPYAPPVMMGGFVDPSVAESIIAHHHHQGAMPTAVIPHLPPHAMQYPTMMPHTPHPPPYGPNVPPEHAPPLEMQYFPPLPQSAIHPAPPGQYQVPVVAESTEQASSSNQTQADDET